MDRKSIQQIVAKETNGAAHPGPAEIAFLNWIECVWNKQSRKGNDLDEYLAPR